MAEAKKSLFQEESVRSFRTEERRVIFASSLGTVFEWYDFYLYAVLAPFFAVLFFPPGNQTAALLSAFAAYAAGFLVRPFGALLFGRIGDLVGRKYTFLITIVVMGASTFAVGPAMPALFTSTSRPPRLFFTSSNSRSTCATSATSVLLRKMSLGRAASALSSMSHTCTRAP